MPHWLIYLLGVLTPFLILEAVVCAFFVREEMKVDRKLGTKRVRVMYLFDFIILYIVLPFVIAMLMFDERRYQRRKSSVATK